MVTAEPQLETVDVVEPVATAIPRLPLLLLVPAIFILALNLRMGIASVGPVLPQVVHDLGTTLVYASLLTTAPVVMMGLASPLSARVGARLGLERTIVVAIAHRLCRHRHPLLG